MTYQEIIDFIKNLKVGRKKLGIYLENHFPDIYQNILEITKFLDETNEKKVEITFAERMYCIENGIYSRPMCIECGKPVYYRVDYKKYREFCSVSCAKSSKQTRSKRENTCLEKYGDSHFHNVDKARDTRFENNNGKWHADDFGSVVKKSKLERHGDENWSNIEKRKDTCLKKYGVESPLESKEIQNKCIESFRRNHPGMSSSMDMPEIRKKIRQGIRLRSWEFINSNTLVEPLFTKEEYLDCDDPTKTLFKFKCKKCGHEFTSTWDNGTASLCEICHPGLKGTSESEMEIANFIREHIKDGWKVYNNESVNRKIISPKEIDIVVYDSEDNIRLLVEYDGLYFHNDQLAKKIDHKYHLKKTEECEKLGYKLIHIFENEWLTNRDIVESRILDNLGLFSNTVFARKCDIQKVSDVDKDKFLIHNHLQGTCKSSVNIGLYHNGELISLMTFGKPRFTKNNELELLRFCNKLGYHIPGAASRLLRNFEREYKPTSLVSYADRRWSNGNLYVKLGFNLDHSSSPNYWYFKPTNPSVVFNRMRFQKYRLKELLEKYDDKLTEVENMRENGYLRIFDCGNLVFVKNYT